jgi:hypothetical protein
LKLKNEIIVPARLTPWTREKTDTCLQNPKNPVFHQEERPALICSAIG